MNVKVKGEHINARRESHVELQISMIQDKLEYDKDNKHIASAYQLSLDCDGPAQATLTLSSPH